MIKIPTIVIFVFFCFSLFSQDKAPCYFHAPRTIWEGNLQLNDSVNLSFFFDVKNTDNKYSIEIYNGEEIIKVDEIVATKDSLNFKMPVFDSEFRLKKQGDSLSGLWINHARKNKNRLFFLTLKTQVTPFNQSIDTPFMRKWEVTFNPENE